MSYSDAPAEARPVRPHEWTVDKQRRFLDALAEHGNVTVAARAVGMSAASAYRLRAKGLAFAYGWRAAAALAYERLRDLALDRATNGVVTPRFYHGAVVSETVRYSDRLLLGLLTHLKPEGPISATTGKRGNTFQAGELWAQTVESYDDALDSGEEPVAPHLADEAATQLPEITREEYFEHCKEYVRRYVHDLANPPHIAYGPGTLPEPGLTPASCYHEINEIAARA